MNQALKLYKNQFDISYPLPSRGEEKNSTVDPYSNTGERSTGERKTPNLTEESKTAFIDFLTIVVPARDMFRFDKFSGLEDFSHALEYYFLKPLGFKYDDNMKGGRNGYKNHWKILVKTSTGTAETVGFFAFGGNNDTICITLTGAACQCIDSEGYTFIKNFIQELGGKISRIDLTHDCLDGEVDIEQVRNWYESGLFRSNARGKYPNAQFIDDLGSGKGCTFYVGSRESGKYFRAYEKGKQLGDANSKWVRLELEILANKRGIPYEILEKQSEYLAGGYECLSYLNIEQSKIATQQKTEQICYDHLEQYAKQSYGRFIEVMLMAWGGCPELVVERLRRDDALPARLIPASIPIKQ